MAHRYFLERGTRGSTDFVPVRDVPGGSGTLDSRITIHILERPSLRPDDAGGGTACGFRQRRPHPAQRPGGAHFVTGTATRAD